jgi:hypothetical protein
MRAEGSLVVRKNTTKRRLLMVFPMIAAMAVPFVCAQSAFATESPARLFLANTNVSAADQQTIVSKHNQYRDEVGVAHLTWDSGLASDAQRWAGTLASQDTGLSHNDPNNADHHEGENLAWSSGSGTSPAGALGLWYAEKATYQAEPNKRSYGANPNFPKWGHYSQMVWSATTKVGCGTATSASGKTYTSCRYSPAGNIEGQLAYPAGNKPAPGPKPGTAAGCKPGYVWRDARDGDGVCVTPGERARAKAQNAAAAQYRQPGGGPYGPLTCKSGYVWRDAWDGDGVCVTPGERDVAHRQNREGSSHAVT